MWEQYNANPYNNRTGDCVVRALSVALDETWEKIYTDLFYQGLKLKGMSSTNAVWGAYLRSKGFEREVIPNTCPDCYTVSAFAEDHPVGRYLLKTHEHVVAVVDGNYYDTFDSGLEVPIYYWERSANNA